MTIQTFKGGYLEPQSNLGKKTLERDPPPDAFEFPSSEKTGVQRIPKRYSALQEAVSAGAPAQGDYLIGTITEDCLLRGYSFSASTRGGTATGHQRFKLEINRGNNTIWVVNLSMHDLNTEQNTSGDCNIPLKAGDVVSMEATINVSVGTAFHQFGIIWVMPYQ